MQIANASPKVTDRMRLGYALWFTMAFLIAIWGVLFSMKRWSLAGESTGCIPGHWMDSVAFSLTLSCTGTGDICGTTP